MQSKLQSAYTRSLFFSKSGNSILIRDCVVTGKLSALRFSAGIWGFAVDVVLEFIKSISAYTAWTGQSSYENVH